MYEDEIPVGKAKDLRGQKFNKLTVLYRVKSHRASSKEAYWKCQCECGNTTEVRSDHLKSNRIMSCGCFQEETRKENGMKTKNLIPNELKDLTNQIFGVLKVIELNNEKSSIKHKIWKCQCLNCGNITYVSTTNLVSGRTKSCGCIKSFGEFTITNILKKNNIVFEYQKSFDNCKYKDYTTQLPRFDFYVNNNYLIEFDGMQHFSSVELFGGEDKFKIQQERDNYKNQWCKENNIPLIRIPYTKLDTLCLEDLMLETTQFRVV